MKGEGKEVVEFDENWRLADIKLILAEINCKFHKLPMKLAEISEKLAEL